MPQNPFLIDQIDIEPGSAGTRRINRDAGTGGLAFQDAVVTTPITLSQIAQIPVANVFTVGKSGVGAQYTTIQSALDAVPLTASATNPYVIVVYPGRYDETVNIVRDGVRLFGVGKPEIRSALEATPDAAGADHTVIISAQLGTIPLSTILQGFTISNVHSTKAALRVLGGAASTVASTGVEVIDCDLNANSAVGNYNLWATAVNRIDAVGGNWTEGSNLGLLLLQEVAWFRAAGVDNIGALSLRYDTANAVSSEAAESYSFVNCGDIAINTGLGTPIAIDLDGAGACDFDFCHLAGQVDLSGDRTVTLRGCVVSALRVLETITVVAPATVVQSVVAANAAAVLDMPKNTGTAVFAAATTATVVFDIPFSDADFQVSFELPSQPANDETPWISNKATTGFRINFATNQTMSVGWVVARFDV